MACEPQILKQVPLFALLDDDELAVLAAQVELKIFVPRQRIYRIGDPGERAYVLVSGSVQVTTVDDDHHHEKCNDEGPRSTEGGDGVCDALAKTRFSLDYFVRVASGTPADELLGRVELMPEHAQHVHSGVRLLLQEREYVVPIHFEADGL